MLHVVLVAEHPCRAPALQRRADAVRPHVLLGVAEAGGEPDAVEVLRQGGVGGVAAEDDAVGVAEDDAHGLGTELLGGVAQHRPGGPQQGRLAVEVALERHLEVVGGDVPLLRSRPRGDDRVTDDVRSGRALAEEGRPGDRQLRRPGGGRGERGRRVRRPPDEAPALLPLGHASLLGAAAIRSPASPTVEEGAGCSRLIMRPRSARRKGVIRSTR